MVLGWQRVSGTSSVLSAVCRVCMRRQVCVCFRLLCYSVLSTVKKYCRAHFGTCRSRNAFVSRQAFSYLQTLVFVVRRICFLFIYFLFSSENLYFATAFLFLFSHFLPIFFTLFGSHLWETIKRILVSSSRLLGVIAWMFILDENASDDTLI